MNTLNHMWYNLEMGGKKSKKVKGSKNAKKKEPFTFKKLFILLVELFAAVLLFVLIINLYIYNFSKKYVYEDISQVPYKYTAVVPGASVYVSGNVSDVLRDRIDGAVALIHNGQAEKFLVSGDHGTKEYDEVNATRKYVLKKQLLPEEKIFMDHAGFSTYETMYRGRDVFCVTDCCIVTQKFHIYRSVYIARKLGLDAVGYIAPERVNFGKRNHLKWNCREVFARVKAFFFVIFKPKPTYLGDIIPITGSGLATWE